MLYIYRGILQGSYHCMLLCRMGIIHIRCVLRISHILEVLHTAYTLKYVAYVLSLYNVCHIPLVGSSRKSIGGVDIISMPMLSLVCNDACAYNAATRQRVSSQTWHCSCALFPKRHTI